MGRWKTILCIACALPLFAGCDDEPSQPPPGAQKVEGTASNGAAFTGYVFPASGTVRNTNGEVVSAQARIVAVMPVSSNSSEVVTIAAAKVSTNVQQQANSNGPDWNVGDTLIKGARR